VNLLLKAKALVDARCSHTQSAPLNMASEKGHLACVQALLAAHATAFKGGMTVKEINVAFGERAGELKKPAKRLALIDVGLKGDFNLIDLMM
jgi:hypothetical protein